MAQYYLIKRYFEREGMSQREIAKKLEISRNTVSKYLKEDEPPTTIERKKKYGRKTPSPETERILPIIDQWLKEDQHVWKKQKHTAARIHQRLVEEYGFKGSESNMRKIVAKRKLALQETFIPLEFQLGHRFQFDWGEADVYMNGELIRIHLFCIQLSGSRMPFVRAYRYENQESFLDGFVHAFKFFGGVPGEGLFDNLKTAVIKVLSGRDRLEQESFQALQAHYVFTAEFCNIRSGNEKGQVEGLVGKVRRNALVPVPHVHSMEELNEHLLHWCLKTAKSEKVPHAKETIYEKWQEEKNALHPLPLKDFEACKYRQCRVNKTSMITLETNQYSVPSRYVGQVVWVKAFVDQVIVVAQNEVIATHQRSYDRDQMYPVLDHYLEVFLRKPRALHDAKAMMMPDIPDVVRRLHKEMHRLHGVTGDRTFVRLLLLHRDVGMENLKRAFLTAEEKGIFTFEGIHEIIRTISGQKPTAEAITKENLPIDLQQYRVKQADVRMFGKLTGGENL